MPSGRAPAPRRTKTPTPRRRHPDEAIHLGMSFVTWGLLPFVAAAMLSLAGVHSLLRWWRHGLTLDVPNVRSSHTRPVPRGGGLGIVLSVCLVLAAANAVHLVIEWRTFVIFLAGAGFVALVSWLDDVHTLSNRSRLVAQSLAALNALAIFGYSQEVSVPYVGEVGLGWVGLPLTFVWILGLTNAFNFMDGVDMLAASQAVVASSFLALLGWMSGQGSLAVAGVVIAGASAGFLPYNRPPASIFMGDIGSVFLGYTLSIAVVYAGRLDGALLIPAVLFFVPLAFDASFTFVRRLQTGQDVFRSHRSHLYQRLVRRGMGHGPTSALYAAMTVAFGFLGLAWYRLPGSGERVAILAVALALCFSLWAFVFHRERHARRAGG